MKYLEEIWNKGGVYNSREEYEYEVEENKKILIGQFDARDVILVRPDGNKITEKSLKETDTIIGYPVLSCNDGLVVYTDNSFEDNFVDFQSPKVQSRPQGNCIVIQQKDGYMVYAHLKHDSIIVTKGTRVLKGQKIGEIGHTGNSSAPHLHFGLYEKNPFDNQGALDVMVKGKPLANFEPYMSCVVTDDDRILAPRMNNTGKVNQFEILI